jgi:hypothetical protein
VSEKSPVWRLFQYAMWPAPGDIAYFVLYYIYFVGRLFQYAMSPGAGHIAYFVLYYIYFVRLFRFVLYYLFCLTDHFILRSIL